MKRLLIAAAITSTLLLSATILRAEDNAPKQPYHTPEQMVERMAERLNLTADQKMKITAVKKDEFEKIRALREENKTKIESYLTAEQKQQLEQRMKDRKKSCDGKEKHKHEHKHGHDD